MLLSILQDVRFTLRQLRKSPGFTFTAVSVLALALGANVAVFTVLSGILLRPLPYAHPERIVEVAPASAADWLPYGDMVQLRDAAGSQATFAAVTMDAIGPASVVTPAGRIQIQQSSATANLFDMLGVHPILGRTFRADENQPGHNRVLLIGEDVWRSGFHADPDVIGKVIEIRNQPFTIIGVLPKGFFFHYSEQMAVWSPGEIKPAFASTLDPRTALLGWIFARVPDGVPIPQFAANLNRAQANIAKQDATGNTATSLRVTSYRELLTGRVRKPLILLYGVVIGIWALAALNLTSLMLTRAVSRTRENAVRSALGASRGRLVTLAVVESLVLCTLGALCGMALGQSLIKVLWRQITRMLPLTQTIHVDWRVMAYLVACTIATALIAAVFPALRATRSDLRNRLTGMASTASTGQSRTREVLVVTQLSLTLVFLVGAGLFLRTIHAYRRVPLGFTQQNVLTGGVILNTNNRMDDQSGSANQPNIVRTSYLPLLERLRAIPGVQSAALSSVLPLRSEMNVTLITNLDHKEVSWAQQPRSDGRIASAGLADALGIPMLRGRFFNEDDSSSSPAVVVVNQSFAAKYMPSQDPIGHIISMGKGRDANMRIVGVIGDMKQMKLDEPTKPEIYFCLSQVQPGSPVYGIAAAFIQVAIRASVPADTLRVQFQKALHEVAPEAVTTDVKTIHEAVEDSFGSQKLIAYLLECFAGIALMIASVGLYGLLSFVVAQRTREIGVRLALGAPQANILSLIMRRAVVLITIGLCLGTGLSWFATRFAVSYIFGVRQHDAFTFAAVAIVLASASLLAAWVPARRAASVDPILALRSE